MRLTLWHGCLIGTITLVTVVILMVMSWFYSTADIRRVQAYAKANGISTTWEEAAFPAPTRADQTAIREFARLAGTQKSLRDMDNQAAPRQIEPANATMRDHYATIPESFWQELDAVIDALPTPPRCLYERVTLGSNFDFIQWQRSLVRLQAERLQCCPVIEIPSHLRRALRLCHVMRNQTLLQHLVDNSCVAIVTSAVTSRRSEMTEADLRLAVAEQLRHLQQTLWDARRDAWRGEAATMFLLSANPQEVARLTWTRAAGSTWAGVLESMQYPLRLLVFRLNRDLVLRHQVDSQIATAAAKDNSDLIRRMQVVPEPVARGAWITEVAEATPFLLKIPSTMISQSLVKQLLVLSVLIADLTNATLPTDHFSATGAALHPVTRNGVVIGWYSVGPNGNDDGGKVSTDFGIPLSATFGKPLFSDEPKPRAAKAFAPTTKP